MWELEEEKRAREGLLTWMGNGPVLRGVWRGDGQALNSGLRDKCRLRLSCGREGGEPSSNPKGEGGLVLSPRLSYGQYSPPDHQEHFARQDAQDCSQVILWKRPLVSNLALRNPRLLLRASTTTNLSSVDSRRAYSLWPFGRGSSNPSSPAEEHSAVPSSALEKPAEPITPAATPDPALEPQLGQLIESTTTSSASQELAALELEHGFLARYTSGTIENVLCALHDQLALPWFLTIPVVIVGIRTVLIPINIWSMKIGARNMTIKPSIDVKISKIKELQTRGEQHKALHAQNELRAYMKTEGFRPLAPLGLPLLQGSLFVSFFWALREMGSHHLPSLTAEGALWFTDLTLAGPWYGLPLIASGLTLLSVETASEMGGLKAGQSQKVMWFLRAVIVGTLWLFHDLPSAVFLYWCTNNMFSLLWGTFIRLIPKSLKARLGIPDTSAINASQNNSTTPSPSFLDGFKAAASSPSSNPSLATAEQNNILPPQPLLWQKPPAPKRTNKNPPKKPNNATT
ncbi:hypothetical protein PTTG_08435 [Puccinia triticina 1-1 BBBD Race 1]|uniref:Membrane insertase YidC/Oxa/ALB C-terminal domain-containing protein n=2 Tax=Puccinia triticina TaxID=208348 RepID=A0A180G9U5_PUCT1|nr:hypothetical protein PTTG_08435 [Puccinia triticina 1-1 BBBD Race 1]